MHKSELTYLTVLRAFAAIWVALHHALSSLSGVAFSDNIFISRFLTKGWLGVDLFFILSGFILAYSYQGKMNELNLETYRDFLIKRLARIFPAHLFTLFIFGAVISIATLLGLFTDHENKFNLMELTAQVFLVHGIGFFEPSGWNIPSWSISSEALAYLAFPFLIKPLQKFGLPFFNVILIISVLLFTIGLAWFFNDAQQFMLPFQFTWIRILSEFLMGMALFQITKHMPKSKWNVILTIVAAACIMLQSLVINSFFDFMYLIYFMVLIHSLALIPRSEKIPFLSVLGEISYSFYLIHSLVIICLNQIVRKVPFLEQQPLLVIGIFIAVSQIAAATIYFHVEIPGRNLICSALLRRKKTVHQLDGKIHGELNHSSRASGL
jgi:peptidoglycan/LPS O-acetylase OafA/YrhL